MPAPDTVELVVGEPVALRLGSALLHGGLLLLLSAGLCAGVRPVAALLCAMGAVVGFALREDRRLRVPARRLRCASGLIDDLGRGVQARVVRVSCAARWCAIAQLRRDDGAVEWLLVGPGQLDNASMRRLLRFLRGLPR